MFIFIILLGLAISLILYFNIKGLFLYLSSGALYGIQKRSVGLFLIIFGLCIFPIWSASIEARFYSDIGGFIAYGIGIVGFITYYNMSLKYISGGITRNGITITLISSFLFPFGIPLSIVGIITLICGLIKEQDDGFSKLTAIFMIILVPIIPFIYFGLHPIYIK